MTNYLRAATALGLLNLAGCLSTWAPYGRVVSEWSGDSTSFESPSVADSNKIPDPSADNSSAAVVPVVSESPKFDSPFDRARMKQQSALGSEASEAKAMPQDAVAQTTPVVKPVEHRLGNGPASVPQLPQLPKTPIDIRGPNPVVGEQPNSLPVGPGAAPIQMVAPVVGGQSSGRTNPTVRGGILGLGANDSTVERAVELAHQLSLLDGENKVLSLRIKQLEADLENREKLLDASNAEVDAASKDVSRARLEIDSLRKDLASARERLRQAAKDDLETLQTILTVLRRLTLTAAPLPMRPSIGE